LRGIFAPGRSDEVSRYPGSGNADPAKWIDGLSGRSAAVLRGEDLKREDVAVR